MSTRWKFAALDAWGVPHTVQTPHGLRAGLLVRSSGGVDLGYVWAAGTSSGAWFWRTPDGTHFGERSSQTAAVRVLVDAHDLRATGCAQQSRLPLRDTRDEDDLDALVDARSAHPLVDGGLYVNDSTRAQRSPLATNAKQQQQPAKVYPKPPAQKIVWADVPDVTAALADSFRKETK